MTESLLSGFQALDLTDQKGFTCGYILAALGVETIVVENPVRNLSREIPPVVKGADKCESLYWRSFNRGKRGITLNLETSRGRELFLRLVEKADFVLESFTPGYLDNLGLGYEVLEKTNPRIIMTSITPFGQNGPHAGYHAGELIVSAMSGVMAGNGEPDRSPLKEGPDTMSFDGGTAAALATVIAHNHRELTGEGQHVDVSLQEVGAVRPSTNLMLWEFDKTYLQRSGAIRNLGAKAVRWVWPCKDGYLFWCFVGGPIGAPANRALSQWMDDDGGDNPLREITDWPSLDMASLGLETFSCYEEAIGTFFLNHTAQEIRVEGLKRGINASIVDTCATVLDNEQLRVRNFWTSPDDAKSNCMSPRHFFLCNNTENILTSTAPSPGEGNTEIYERLGLTERDIEELRETGII
jgi:crotonobetainyl-CoA:carnitine CoA-transferase CaiB-like acyl-CoA transferase